MCCIYYVKISYNIITTVAYEIIRNTFRIKCSYFSGTIVIIVIILYNSKNCTATRGTAGSDCTKRALFDGAFQALL